MKQKIKETFTRFKSAQTLYETSDGQTFFKFNDAHNWARGLKDNKVVKHVREETKKEETKKGLPKKGNDKAGGNNKQQTTNNKKQKTP